MRAQLKGPREDRGRGRGPGLGVVALPAEPVRVSARSLEAAGWLRLVCDGGAWRR